MCSLLVDRNEIDFCMFFFLNRSLHVVGQFRERPVNKKRVRESLTLCMKRVEKRIDENMALPFKVSKQLLPFDSNSDAVPGNMSNNN